MPLARRTVLAGGSLAAAVLCAGCPPPFGPPLGAYWPWRARIAGRKFLNENAKRTGVVTTASGLQYEVLASGAGDTPRPNDRVTVHYHETLLNGRVLHSSMYPGKPPLGMPPLVTHASGNLAGWAEALQMMRVGDRWKLFIPPQLAHGKGNWGRNVGPHETLITEIELLAVQDALSIGRAFLVENTKREGVVTTASGLQYEVLASGAGDTPGPHDTVTVNYRGTYADGGYADFPIGSRDVRVGGKMAGWTEALQLMRVGGKWKLFIPYELAYGEHGDWQTGIGPFEALIYEIELLAVRRN